MFKARSGKSEMSDVVAIAKMRINKAFEALGRGKDGPNPHNPASGTWSAPLQASLELLALHYGMVGSPDPFSGEIIIVYPSVVRSNRTFAGSGRTVKTACSLIRSVAFSKAEYCIRERIS
jgi:hypothetical protein